MTLPSRTGGRTTVDGLVGDHDIKDVTDEEVQRFWADGWVTLPGLLSAGLAAELLARARTLMGPGGDQNELRAGFDFETAGSSQPFRQPSASDPVFEAVTRSAWLGRNAALLLGRDCAQRFFDDTLLVKLPMNHWPDRAQALGWHSDTNPTDRTWLSFWIALDAVGRDQGGVRYLSGSHKLGQLWRGGACVDLEQAYELAPRLRSCPMSDPVNLRAGDAIAHCSGVVHAADANTGTAPRWVHRVTYFPADAVYMGIPSRAISDRRIEPFDILDHDDFPVVYRPATAGDAPSALVPQVRRFHGA